MLIHVSGKLSDGRPVSTRIESLSAVLAIAGFASKLPEGLTVVSIQAKPVQETADVYIGEPKTAEQIAASKAKRAANKAAKLTGAANGTVPTAVVTEPTPTPQPTARSATARK